MKKDSIIGVFIAIIALAMFSILFTAACNNSTKSYESQTNYVQVEDSALVSTNGITKNDSLTLQHWFNDYQRKNPDWLKEKDGMKKLRKSFEEKMTSNINFAIETSYDFSYLYENGCQRIFYNTSMAAVFDENYNEDGELKSFKFKVTLDLLKPMYNGKRTIDFTYEIFNVIPASIENHEEPYLKKINHCQIIDPYLTSGNDNSLGSFIISYKKK